MNRSKVLHAICTHGDALALEAYGRQLSYADLQKEIDAFAGYVRGQQAVALLMQNSMAWVIADLACVQENIPCVPLPPFFTNEQCEHAMRDAGVSLLITDSSERFGTTAKQIVIAGCEVTLMERSHPPAKLPVHTAKITYTSGTTGKPKGVCLTQESMEKVAASLLHVLNKDIAQRHICLLPLAILLENVAGVYCAILAGATCILTPVNYEPQALAEAINKAHATSCILVPELLRMLIASNTPTPSLKFAAVGGARVALSLLKTAHLKGIPAYEGYGISENASVITLNTPSNYKHGTAGKPLPHIELRIDKHGEILIKNALFSGYIGEETATSEWYRTGDLGKIDDEGFLHIHGRKRNVFITSFGRNVSPEWPESLLAADPTIAQAAVFGEAMPYPVAVIVARDPQQVPATLERVNAALPDYAKIHAFVIARTPFLPDNGQLTGNGRLKRNAIFTAYRPQIEACIQTQKKEAV